ncbi:MAG: transketolase [Planctomycetes bacterium]|nr:transketolase [Planctomycetota bacterium]
MISQDQLVVLSLRAREIRLTLLRMMGAGKAHHFGGSLSCVEILTALYFYKMHYEAGEPGHDDRDRLILSKGHAVPTQYACLAALGVLKPEEVPSLKTLGSRLQGHPDVRKTPGLEAPTGSLGQGLSFANGLALAARLDGAAHRIYVLLGDGELDEGQVWEAAMTSAHYRLDNLTAIVDRNGLQAQGATEAMKRLDPIVGKWAAFGWNVLQCNGHDLSALCAALDEATAVRGRPSVLIARTVKGKGVSFLEGRYQYHNAALSADEVARALGELGQQSMEHTD